MHRLAELISGRRSKYLVAALFVALAAGLASQAGKAQTTSGPAVSLPESAESLAALQAIKKFPSGDVVTAITVAYRPGGLTAADLAALRELRGDIVALELPGTASTSRLRVSSNGTGAVLITKLSGLSRDEIVAAVQAIRAEVAELDRGGLRVAVTGPAAIAADLASVFSAINSTLLIGAAALVLVLLIVVYRSPVFWLIPFVTVLLAEAAQRGMHYFLSQWGVPITGQAAGIASVLTFGAATDYALLLVARYREELLRRHDRHEAMYHALRSAAPAIIASAGTVILALLSLLLAKVGTLEALGPLGATGVALAMLLSLTLLPALLLIGGRRAFWPRVPHAREQSPDPRRGVWAGLGRRVRRRPRPIWAIGIAVLVLLSLGLTQLNLGLSPAEQFATEQGSVTGKRLLDAANIEVGSAGILIVVPDRSRTDEVRAAVGDVEGVRSVRVVARGQPGSLLAVTLRAGKFGAEALSTVPDVRRAAHRAAEGALVGGPTAQQYDLRQAAIRDTIVIVPVVLALVLLVLLLLLRTVLLPLLLLGTVILSFLAALGVGVLASEWIFGFAGLTVLVPLLSFVFLVALGVDYNIFLVERIRQESRTHGTDDGMLRALAATGAVITSAGIVLAGTFSILTVIPFVALIQVGVIIAFGVLLDTFLVRSVIVPALVWDLGRRVWWPAREPSDVAEGSRNE